MYLFFSLSLLAIFLGFVLPFYCRQRHHKYSYCLPESLQATAKLIYPDIPNSKTPSPKSKSTSPIQSRNNNVKMGANNSHLPRHRSRPSSRTSPSTPATTFSPSSSTPSTAQGSPATTYTTPSPTSFSGPSDDRTSISCEPSSSPISSRANVPLRIGYPYYEEVALEAKRGSRRRSRSLSKVLDHIGFSGSSNNNH